MVGDRTEKGETNFCLISEFELKKGSAQSACDRNMMDSRHAVF